MLKTNFRGHALRRDLPKIKWRDMVRLSTAIRQLNVNSQYQYERIYMTINQKSKCQNCKLYDVDMDMCIVDDDCLYKDNGILLDNATDSCIEK